MSIFLPPDADADVAELEEDTSITSGTGLGTVLLFLMSCLVLAVSLTTTPGAAVVPPSLVSKSKAQYPNRFQNL
jgi:hypothetical protein